VKTAKDRIKNIHLNCETAPFSLTLFITIFKAAVSADKNRKKKMPQIA
jgi:hypothetical protein